MGTLERELAGGERPDQFLTLLHTERVSKLHSTWTKIILTLVTSEKASIYAYCGRPGS